MSSGTVLYVRAGARAPRFTRFPQIRKLADRSDVISAVLKCSEIKNFRGSAPDPAGGAYNTQTHCPHPSQDPHLPRFYGSQGLTRYRVGNPTNDRFQICGTV